MTTLTRSVSAAGQTTTVWVREPVVVSRRRPAVRRWSASTRRSCRCGSPYERSPRRNRRCRLRQGRAPEHDEHRGLVAPEVPGATGVADLLEPGRDQRPEVFGRAVAAESSTSGPRLSYAVGDQRLEIRVGARGAPSTSRGATGRTRRSGAAAQAAKAATAGSSHWRAQDEECRRSRGMRGVYTRSAGSASAEASGGSAALVVLRRTWYARPSYRCAGAPDHRSMTSGRTNHCGPADRPSVPPTPNATIGNHLGRRSRVKETASVARGRFRRRDPGPDHEPSNYGSFGHQARELA